MAAHSGSGGHSRTSRNSRVTPSSVGVSVVTGHNVMESPELRCMEPLARLLQLFCENHNTDMQVREKKRERKGGREGGRIERKKVRERDC